MINNYEILETIRMIENEKLDIRTVTMGISLLDCIDKDIDIACENVYKKITTMAKDLVPVCEEIEDKYGIPIVNKRISVTPIAMLANACHSDAVWKFAVALDKAAEEVGVDFIGGYTALVHKGYTKGDLALVKSLPKALSTTNKVCSSINVASSKAGINLDAIKDLGHIIKDLAYLTKEEDSIGCAKFVVFANAVEDNPFMAGAFHGVGESEAVINVGVSGPGVVSAALKKVPDASITEVAETIKKIAFKITRVGQLVALEASEMLNVPFGIVDLSLAPTPAIGDSVAHILEEIGLDQVGGHGTTAALALLNDAVKKGGVMASSHVGGLSGAFIPVSEDAGMIDAVRSGSLTLEKLEAMTAVCSVGLDMIAVPGDTSAAVISGLIADEISIGVVNHKTTAVRVIPAYDKEVGEEVEFGGLLGTAPIMPINQSSPSTMINRGGRIPAPLHSLKN